jgi:hypothetical protein
MAATSMVIRMVMPRVSAGIRRLVVASVASVGASRWMRLIGAQSST